MSEWQALSTDPQVRLRAIREYATCVLGSVDAAARWLDRTIPAVRGGTCAVAAACESPVGFYEAMAELARINQFEQREARKRARMARQAVLASEQRPPPAPSADPAVASDPFLIGATRPE